MFMSCAQATLWLAVVNGHDELLITSKGCKFVLGMSILKVQSSYLHCAKTCILLIIESYGITEVS